jgi:hypothetical protein
MEWHGDYQDNGIRAALTLRSLERLVRANAPVVQTTFADRTLVFARVAPPPAFAACCFLEPPN